MAPAGEGSYPRQVPIDAYGNGGFRFAGMSHRGSLLCLPTGMFAWPVANASELSLTAFDPILSGADRIDVLLVGLGADIAPLDGAIRAAMRSRGIIVEGIGTGGAVRTYNVLLAEERRIAAALIAVENVR